MLSRRSALLLTALALVVGAVMVMLAIQLGGENPPARDSGAAVGAPEDPPIVLSSHAEGMDTAQRQRQEISEPPHASSDLVVLDANGAPIPGAVVWRDIPEVKWFCPDAPRDDLLVGTTGEDGVVPIALPLGVHLQVAKKGYVSRGVELAELPARVEMERAGNLSFYCYSALDGLPMKDVTIMVTAGARGAFRAGVLDRSSIDESHTACLPAAPITDRLFVVRSGVDGAASVPNLPPGQPLAWYAWGPDGWACDDDPGSSGDAANLTASGQTIGIQFVPLRVCAIVVRGDAIVSYRGVPTAAHRVHNSTWMRAAKELQLAISKDLEPGAIVAAYPLGDMYEATLMLRERGLRSIRVPFTSLAEFKRTGATIVDAALLQETGGQLERVVVRLRNPGGDELAGVHFKLVPQGDAPNRLWVDMTCGVPHLVPSGRYQLATLETALQVGIKAVLGKECSIEVPHSDGGSGLITKTIDLARDFVAVTIRRPSVALRAVCVFPNSARVLVPFQENSDVVTWHMPFGKYEFREPRTEALLATLDLNPQSMKVAVDLKSAEVK